MSSFVVEADWTWTGAALEAGVRVAVAADGRIAAVGAIEREPDVRLSGKALLPGFVNAHSHAFQRGLRGAGELFPEGAGSFWTWREAMYALVEHLDDDAFREVTLRAFRDMRRAGITTVGEFHYLHHSPRGEDFAFDDLMLDVAREAGIRLVLLQAYYRTGGIDRPLAGGQLRFRTDSPESYVAQLDRLAGRLDPSTQSLGIVAHSLRAAEPAEVALLYAEARRRRLPFHMHVEEQRQEIDDCRRRWEDPPMAVILRACGGAEGFTAVHCTHTRSRDMTRFLAAGGTVCLCPTTEANLGDGIADVPAMLAAGAVPCLGTDSNSRISMLEEARWLEYGQRLRGERRGVVVDETGALAPRLLAAATERGAAALGVAAGRLEAGRWADFALVDLAHPSLAGWTPETLLPALFLGADEGAIAASCVGGRWSEPPA
ncbi:MAG: formimidoylglutamate deiminase [Thermoanaerobaculia bacterium]